MKKLLIPTIALALVLAACSGDDAETTTTTTAPEATTTTTPPEATTTTTSAPEETTTTTAPADDVTAFAWPGTAPNLTPASEATAAEWQQLADSVRTQVDGVNGMWIAVSDPELGYWVGASGNAVADGAAATIDDHSRIGSVTKTFTATAVLEQIAAGEVALTDTVAELVPEVSAQFPETADITVEQLLAMRSGLTDYANTPGAVITKVPEDPTRIWTPEDLISTALEAAPSQPPGSPIYSTTNYTILGLILESITGEPVEETLTDLAGRAGLGATALLPGEENEMPSPSSHGYVEPNGSTDLATIDAIVEPDTDVTDWSLSWGGAGGGIYSVIEDLFTWAASGSGTDMLPADLAATRLQMRPVPGVGAYGLGIYEVFPGWVGHTGQVIGWEALAATDPETGATYAVMLNGTSSLGSTGVSFWDVVFGGS
jgi:D-alanyl-D-alanine carboxypeptidase